MAGEEVELNMSGSIDELVNENPRVARAKAVVELINQAATLLRDFRKERGLTQDEMATKLGISQPRVAQLESGKPGNAPSLEQLAEFAFHCGYSLAICDKSQMKP